MDKYNAFCFKIAYILLELIIFNGEKHYAKTCNAVNFGRMGIS